MRNDDGEGERTPELPPSAQSPNFPNLSYFKTLNLISEF